MGLRITLQISDDETKSTLQGIVKLLGEMNMKIDDLKAAVKAEEVELQHLTDAVPELETNVNAIIAALKAAQTSGTSDADLDGVIESLTAHAQNLGDLTAALKSFNPA